MPINTTRSTPPVKLHLHLESRPYIQTSRDRPKSAPYLRLKNTKRTSKCQSIGELGTLLWKIFFRKKVSKCRKKTEREDHLGVFKIHSVQKYQKIEGGTLW